MVGNGVINWTYDTQPATVDVSYFCGLLDQRTYDGMQATNCNWTLIPFDGGASLSFTFQGYLDKLSTYMYDIDIYNIYAKCWGVNAS